MATRKKKEVKKWKLNLNPKPKINPNIPDISNDPFILEKARRAVEMIDKYGLPKELQNK